jgi:hypothetical protein
MRTIQMILVSGLFAGLICGGSGCSRSRWLSRKEYSEIQDPFTDSEEGIAPSRFADSGDAPKDAAGGEVADASAGDSSPSGGGLDGPKPIRQASGKKSNSAASSVSHASYPDSSAADGASIDAAGSETATAGAETQDSPYAAVRNGAGLADSEDFSEWAADQPAAVDSVQSAMEENSTEDISDEAAGAFAEADSEASQNEPVAAGLEQDSESGSEDFSSMTAASAFDDATGDAQASESVDEQSEDEVTENPFSGVQRAASRQAASPAKSEEPEPADSPFFEPGAAEDNPEVPASFKKVADSSAQRVTRESDSVDAEEADWNSELENMSQEFAEPLINETSAAREEAAEKAEAVSGRFKEKAAAIKSMPAANPFRQQKRSEPQEPEWESAPETATPSDENSDPFSSAARRQTSRNTGKTRKSGAGVNDVSPFSPDGAWKSSSTMK